jgi:enoyl-CoA hydratase/carnithine racemase
MSAVTSDEESVLFDAGSDGVGLITLHRPERRNAWNPGMERRFYEVLDAAERDPLVRACVLTGAGRSFCPGVDAQRLGNLAGSPLDLSGRRSPSFTLAFRKPLIAAINGACAGFGLVQALMCDVRFAARGAKLSTSFARRGLAGEYGGDLAAAAADRAGAGARPAAVRADLQRRRGTRPGAGEPRG